MLRCLEAEPDAVLNGLDDLIALEGRSDRHILACLYNALTLRGAFPGEWVEEICLFAEHAAAALCLCARAICEKLTAGRPKSHRFFAMLFKYLR